MENNNLKEQVRKDVKEKIAVSNIRKEFDMSLSLFLSMSVFALAAHQTRCAL